MILVDANILLRMCNRHDALYQHTTETVFAYRQSESLAIVPQSLYEFWAVATRDPVNNGTGMDPERAMRWLVRFSRLFHLLSEPAEMPSLWTDLVSKYRVTGFRCHDARYVAMMQAHGITRLMTYNVKHFASYPITIIDPAAPGPGN